MTPMDLIIAASLALMAAVMAHSFTDQ